MIAKTMKPTLPMITVNEHAIDKTNETIWHNAATDTKPMNVTTSFGGSRPTILATYWHICA
jgi:hypothetical protein